MRAVFSRSSINRCERIKNLRIKLLLHSNIAKQSGYIKGEHHFDTIYYRDIVEELSAAIANERRLIEMDMEIETQSKHDSWDITMMEKNYEL